MATIVVSSKFPIEHASSCYVFLLSPDSISSVLSDLGNQLGVDVATMLSQHDFTGKVRQIVEFAVLHKGRLVRVLCAGLGASKEKKKLDIEGLRRSLAAVYRKIAGYKIESFVLCTPDHTLFGLSPYELGTQMTIALEMAAYHFDEFITEADRKAIHVEDITICCQTDVAEFERGVQDGTVIAQGVNRARYWIDLPPSLLTPPHLADKAIEIVNQHPNELKVTVFNEDEVNKMGMGGLASVSRGSEVECRLLIIEYRGAQDNSQPIAIVGKGITFDSGGLSIKPALSMETMKDDMSGAAAVIATMGVLAILKPRINVVALAPLAENLPSGKATKPGDIVRFYNGKTAEVLNTDAEGRLILADALSYAVQHYNPQAIIDLATLTGACAHALGPFFSGLFGEDEALINRIKQAGNRCGERVWQLPMDDDYKGAIRSPVADICNIGKSAYKAGAITAAHFLQHFVGDVPWVHLDIAGTAFDVPDIPYYRPGATGVGVRLLTDLIMNW